ncbi:T9SS type A sorting domain-containing protein [Longitalea arenae]|uniref:T9SS type A sorting domain-containing protein n=1 Tax=Longitalea arenae TaxID=2812558 RepID=UPI001967EC60|nr:T9SS type A sorting domain-containing protein [Longitalea arenae]
MKKIVLILLMAKCAYVGYSQVITPTVQGKFGIDADAQSNMFVTTSSSCNDCDDWFFKQVPNGNNSMFVIDTTGAGAILAGYQSNAATRNIPFYRKMGYPSFYQTNQRTLIDAVFVRDYHDHDQTAFTAGSNKNGDSPEDWTGESSNMLSKNDILDVFLHLRREGPNYNPTDQLWLFGAVAIEGTNGSRWFDFELYQTDIFYTRSTSGFTGFGPDAGHTAWKFDAAGNVTQVGDMIFAASYSGGLESIEARIWVDEAELLNTIPATFDWTGTFGGGKTQYGYAGIQPKNGDPFYFGVENAAPTWGGPWWVPRANGGLVQSYATGQFMEFGINLTVLGLDPVSLMGKTPCGIPFSKVMVKTRSSESFTSELKDFIAPFDLFLPPSVDVAADIPVFCGSSGVSTISVTNPYSTSIYNWTTTDGSIAVNNGTSITVDQPGTYKVTQVLENDCPAYAIDSATIVYDPACSVLGNNRITVTGSLNNGLVNLDWSVTSNKSIKNFTIERSTDGVHYTAAGEQHADPKLTYSAYKATDEVFGVRSSRIYYRIKATGYNGEVQYSKAVELSLTVNALSMKLTPNPVKNTLFINIASQADKDVQVFIYDITGNLVRSTNTHVQKGFSTIKMNDFDTWAKGMYTVKVVSGSDVLVERMLLTK